MRMEILLTRSTWKGKCRRRDRAEGARKGGKEEGQRERDINETIVHLEGPCAFVQTRPASGRFFHPRTARTNI